MTWNTSLYWSHTSPMFFCIQNSDFSPRIASYYGSQPSKAAWLAPELLVSMGLRPHLSFCACKTTWLASEILSLYGSLPSFAVFECETATLVLELQVSMGPIPHLWFFVLKAATLAPELQVSIGPSPHLWFLNAKQRLLDLNSKSLWVPNLTYSFVACKTRR